MNEFERGWLIGFIEACGSFTRNRVVIVRGSRRYVYVTPQFFLTTGDTSAVRLAQRLLGMGRITLGGRRLEIRRKEELLRFAGFLEGKLRTERRRKEFEGWKRLLLQWKERGGRPGTDKRGGGE